MSEDCTYVGGGILNLFKDASLFYRIVGTVMRMASEVSLFTEMIYCILHCGR